MKVWHAIMVRIMHINPMCTGAHHPGEFMTPFLVILLGNGLDFTPVSTYDGYYIMAGDLHVKFNLQDASVTTWVSLMKFKGLAGW